MDILSGVKSEVLRPTLILLVPGLVVAMPSVFVLGHYQPELFAWTNDHPTLSTILGFLAAVSLGMITHDIGTHIEADIIDRRLKSKDPAFEDEWYRYLRIAYPERSVAQSYIHANVLNLKFELGMTAASPLALVLSAWAWSVRDDVPCGWFVVLAAALIVGTAYFLYEANQTAQVLARVRKEVAKGIGVPPKLLS